MTFDELKEYSHKLPEEPGVYIMRNHADDVIYVGKAKKLRNRVSQYFLDTVSHTPKTRLMVSNIDHFEVIITESEFEALVLESSLIKRYKPKYNILLKDDKGYPYLRLDMREAYPRINLVGKKSDDGAEYFGPFGSRSVTNQALDSIYLALKLPTCSKKFPREIGKSRPCLNYHMNQCSGWCTGNQSKEEYRAVIEQARELMRGNCKAVAEVLRKQMEFAAENLNFELAAALRDRVVSVENLGNKQFAVSSNRIDTDVIGFAQTDVKACFCVLHYSAGNLIEKEHELLQAQDNPESALSELVRQYYLNRNDAPKQILLPLKTEDIELIERFVGDLSGKKVHLLTPARGDKRRLIDIAQKNAYEEALRATSSDERIIASLTILGKMLDMEPPVRIESYDISNISGTDNVSGMIVYQNGRPRRSEYKRFNLDAIGQQDDYASMYETVLRRFRRYQAGDDGFHVAPDLILIDGGANHAATAQKALRALDLNFPVFGMVKDDNHRTRALVTPDGKEIAITGQQSVFLLVASIQEETHRFAINYHRKLRSKRLQYSQLDSITGIGPKRKQDLLKQFKTISGIKAASLSELERILPKDAAMAVYQYYHEQRRE